MSLLVHRPAPKSSPPAFDRRSGRDRRKVEKGPPGGRERRVHMEPRKPEVVERDITPSEWAALQSEAAPKKG
jgi:hypothetical protein